MPNVGPLELLVVLVIALIVLGPKRLPEVGRSLGRGIREFKDTLSGITDDEDDDGHAPPPLTPGEAESAGTTRTTSSR